MTTHTVSKYRGRGTDCRVFFKRPDNSIYAIIGPNFLKRLKDAKQLGRYLREQRQSGIVFIIAKA